MTQSDASETHSGPTVWTLGVPEMTCGHCEAAVTAEIMALGGVSSVSVDLATKTVTVVGTGLDAERLGGAIDEAGFDLASIGSA